MFVVMAKSEPDHDGMLFDGVLVGCPHATLEDAEKALEKDAMVYPWDNYQILKLVIGKENELVYERPARCDP